MALPCDTGLMPRNRKMVRDETLFVITVFFMVFPRLILGIKRVLFTINILSSGKKLLKWSESGGISIEVGSKKGQSMRFRYVLLPVTLKE